MFMYLLVPFILQNLAPFILIQSYESVPFWGSKWPNCYYFHLPIGPFHFFFFLKGGGGVFIIIIYQLAPFIVQNFLKITTADPELWGCAIFGPKWPTCLDNFFRIPVNQPCSFNSCLSTCLSIQIFSKHAVFTEC